MNTVDDLVMQGHINLFSFLALHLTSEIIDKIHEVIDKLIEISLEVSEVKEDFSE